MSTTTLEAAAVDENDEFKKVPVLEKRIANVLVDGKVLWNFSFTIAALLLGRTKAVLLWDYLGGGKFQVLKWAFGFAFSGMCVSFALAGVWQAPLPGLEIAVVVLSSLFLMVATVFSFFLLDLKILNLVVRTFLFWINLMVIAIGLISLSWMFQFDYRMSVLMLYLTALVLITSYDAIPPKLRFWMGIPAFFTIIVVTLALLSLLSFSRFPSQSPSQQVNLGNFEGWALRNVTLSPSQVITDCFVTHLFFMVRILYHTIYHFEELFFVRVSVLSGTVQGGFDPFPKFSPLPMELNQVGYVPIRTSKYLASLLDDRGHLPWRFESTLACKLCGPSISQNAWMFLCGGVYFWGKFSLLISFMLANIVVVFLGAFLVVGFPVFLVGVFFATLWGVLAFFFLFDLQFMYLVLRSGEFWAQMLFGFVGMVSLGFIVLWDYRCAVFLPYGLFLVMIVSLDAVPEKARRMFLVPSLLGLIFVGLSILVLVNCYRVPGQLNMQIPNLGDFGGWAAADITISPVQLISDALIGHFILVFRSLYVAIRAPKGTLLLVSVFVENKGDIDFDHFHSTRSASRIRIENSQGVIGFNTRNDPAWETDLTGTRV